MPLNSRFRAILTIALLLATVGAALGPWASQPALAATFTVTSLADSGAGSLRQAIIDANASPAADTISFGPATNGGTIALASPLPALANSGALAIVGNGATSTTVSGGGAVPVFAVSAGASVSISGLTITGGAAGAGVGGGINNNGALTVTSSVIRGNAATDGGGIYTTTGSALTVINSSVSGNVATVGGGIFSFGTTVTVIDSTLSGNSGATGGGIFNNNATLLLRNSIIANSISGGGDCVSATSTVNAQSSLVEDASCGVASGVAGNLTGDPALNANLTLGAGSVAVDAGSNALVPGGLTADLAGNARVQGARVDMGAYESGFIAPPTLTPTATLTPSATPIGPSPTPTLTPTATTPAPAPDTPTPRPKPRATATPLGRITGTVIDLTTGAPVPGIAVQVGDAVVQSDANGNYNRDGLAAGDYPVQLQLTADQGQPAQGLIVVALPAGATVVQHLALRTPLPAAAPADPAAPVAELPAPAAPTAGPAPVPAQLPRTSSAGELGWPPIAAAALALIVAGLGLRRRRA